MVVIETNHRHAAEARKSLAYLKELSASLDGWELSNEKDGVKLYSRAAKDSSISIVRGDIELKSSELTPRQVASVATQPGARKIWDEKFDVAHVKEMYSCWESLFWVKIKAPWPVSPRDFVGIALRDFDDDECYVSMSSVTDDAAVPPVSGCVRGNLMISGWKITKTANGVAITYITQVDLAGSIPSSFLKSINLQVPLCAGKVADYAQTYGFPPSTIACSATYVKESFDHAKREFVAELDGQGGECTWEVSGKMYPNGIKVSTKAEYEIVDGEHRNKRVVIKNVNGPTTVTISKA